MSAKLLILKMNMRAHVAGIITDRSSRQAYRPVPIYVMMGADLLCRAEHKPEFRTVTDQDLSPAHLLARRGFRRVVELMRRTSLQAVATLLCAGAVVTTASTRVDAQTIRVNQPVIELFTSQGCSLCPYADSLLEEYVARDDVIAFSLNVDYWDYLGWKDTLGHAAHTQRQRAYAETRGDNRVYTPQIVVGGRTHVIGSRQGDIDKALAEARVRAASSPISLAVETSAGGEMLVRAFWSDVTKVASTDRQITIWMAGISQRETVKIRRGENRGRSITYHNVARDLTRVGTWSGQDVILKIDAGDVEANVGRVILLQDGPAGPIIAAAEIWG